MGERIKQLRKALGLTQKEFGERIGVKPNTIGTYEIGRNEPIDAVVSLICREFNVNEDWLRYGTEPMDLNAGDFDLGKYIQARGASELEITILKAYFELDADTRQKLIEHFKSRLSSMPVAGADTVAEAIEEITPEEMAFFIPWFFQPMSAGAGEEAGQERPEDLEIKKKPPKGTSFVARVKGNSMEPTYQDGDLVFVKAQPRVEIGEIGAFYMDGQMWIKERGDGVLLSHNEMYDPVPMRDDIECQGLVLGVCDERYFE